MPEKVYIDNDKKGTIVCPKCGKPWVKDFSGFKNFDKKSGLNCKCPCGHSFPIKLERRQHFRKSTQLTGSYVHDKTKIRGLVNIKDISETGIGIELNTKQMIPPGDKLLIKFNLNDSKKSFLCKEAVIKKSDGINIGLEFTEKDCDDDLKIYIKE